MTLNEIGKLFLVLAKEKGWGHTKEMLDVTEKMMLINTEITELHEAMLKKPKKPKDTIQSETADILGRTLHLGLVWEVDFDAKQPYKFRFGSRKETLEDKDYLYLYSLVSKGYDNYRHKRVTVYKRFLYRIAHEVLLLAKSMDIDIENAIMKKVEINKTRNWSKNKLMGHYYKE